MLAYPLRYHHGGRPAPFIHESICASMSASALRASKSAFPAMICSRPANWRTISSTTFECRMRASKCSPRGPLLPASQFLAVRSLTPVHRMTDFTARWLSPSSARNAAAMASGYFILSLPVWSKIKTVGKTGVIPSRRSLAAYRPLHFFGAINGALCGSADKWGETHGVGTYPGLHYGDGGPGAAAAE